MSYKFPIATMPAPGHVAPFAPLVRELLRRGYEVVWYGSRHYRKGIEATVTTSATRNTIDTFQSVNAIAVLDESSSISKRYSSARFPE